MSTLVSRFTFDEILPAKSPDLAVKSNVILPVGGPFGTGGPYLKGTVLGNVASVTVQSEVRRLSVTGTPTGFNGFFNFVTGSRTLRADLPNLVTDIPTATQVQTTLERIFGVGNVTVTKSALVYDITFAGSLANLRIGGLLTFSASFTAGTSPAAAMTRQTVGSAGSGQYDVALDASSDGTQVAKAILIRDFASSQFGGRDTEFGVGGQLETPAVYTFGFFYATDLRGYTSTMHTAVGQFNQGSSLTDPQTIVRFG